MTKKMGKRKSSSLRLSADLNPNDRLGANVTPPDNPRAKNLLISFKDFTEQQGDKLSAWQTNGLLQQFIEKLKHYTGMTVNSILQASGNTLSEYGAFPPKSKYRKPRHTPEDAVWASMHINGKVCVAGHLVENVFYVVFLDSEHKFWPTAKKGT